MPVNPQQAARRALRNKRIVEQARRGDLIKIIAHDNGVSVDTVHDVCRDAGLPSRIQPAAKKDNSKYKEKKMKDLEARRQAIADYYNGGASVRDTMSEFKCASNTVKDCVVEAGYKMRWESRKRSMTPARDKKALKLFKAGRSKLSIAREFGVSATTIALALVRQGVEPVKQAEADNWPEDDELIALNKKAAFDAMNQPLTVSASMIADIDMPTDRLAARGM